MTRNGPDRPLQLVANTGVRADGPRTGWRKDKDRSWRGLAVRDQMIRRTLQATKEATFAVLIPHPDPSKHGMPIAFGTCFMVDPAGWALTANHVIADENGPREIYCLMRPGEQILDPGAMVQGVSIVHRWPEVDIALLHADFAANSNKDWLQGRTGFPHLSVTDDVAADGTPVYSYGFPLPPDVEVYESDGIVVGLQGSAPRTTSAIVASNQETFGSVRTDADPRFYVTDKAFNYGNSGGPLVLQETGEAIAVVVRFQPLSVPQRDRSDVVVPSLYGVASAVGNIQPTLRELMARQDEQRS